MKNSCPNCDTIYIYCKGHIVAEINCMVCDFPIVLYVNKIQPTYLVKLDDGTGCVVVAKDCLEYADGPR